MPEKQFQHQLASDLKIPLYIMLNDMPCTEYVEWMAYYAIMQKKQQKSELQQKAKSGLEQQKNKRARKG